MDKPAFGEMNIFTSITKHIAYDVQANVPWFGTASGRASEGGIFFPQFFLFRLREL